MERTEGVKDAAKVLIEKLREEIGQKQAEVADLEGKIAITLTLCNGELSGVKAGKQEESSSVGSSAAQSEVNHRFHDAHKTGRTFSHGMNRNTKRDRHDWPGVIRGIDGQITIQEIMRKTGVEKGYAASRIHALKKQGYLRSVDRGIYVKTNKVENVGRN